MRRRHITRNIVGSNTKGLTQGQIDAADGDAADPTARGADPAQALDRAVGPGIYQSAQLTITQILRPLAPDNIPEAAKMSCRTWDTPGDENSKTRR
jgi:hypothetical protein